MVSATSRVFALPELLERILLHCDPRSLLRAHAVSGSFYTQIRDSHRIEQKLFLEPYKKILAYPINNEKDLVPQVTVNPFILDTDEDEIAKPVCPEDIAGDVLPEFVIHENLWSRDIAKDSWCRSMHLTSPPMKRIELGISHHESPTSGKALKWLPGSVPLGDGNYNVIVYLEHPDGILVGDVLDVLEDCRVLGKMSMFYVQMYVEVDDAQREEINYEGKHYARKELIEVQADDDRLMKVTFDVNVQQSRESD